jgi:N-acetylglucosamine kinase-like BadF-type ATPase
VLRGLDGRGSATLLTGPVTAALDAVAHADPDEHAQAVIRVAYRRPPATLGLLAPLVGSAAQAGDEVARHIVETAAAHLLHALDVVSRRGGPLDRPPIVVAGSVLLNAGPVAERVRAGIRERFRVVPAEARNGAAGAAALAIARVTGAPIDDAVHARLTAEA